MFGLLVSRTPSVAAAGVTIQLYGRFMTPTGWSVTPGNESDPGPLISVNRGDRVTMQLTSEDGTPHIFWIDYDNDGTIDAGEPQSLQFTGSTSFTFDALQAGTFTYWCAIHKPVMRGTWVTNASDITPPTIASVAAVPARQAPGGFVNLSAGVTDDTAVTTVSVHVVGPALDVNLTMARGALDEWYLNRTYESPGAYSFTIWAGDARGNVQSRGGSFSIGTTEGGSFDYGPLLIVSIAVISATLGLLIWASRRRR